MSAKKKRIKRDLNPRIKRRLFMVLQMNEQARHEGEKIRDITAGDTDTTKMDNEMDKISRFLKQTIEIIENQEGV